MRLPGKSHLFLGSAALILAACWSSGERLAGGSASEATNGGKLTGRIVLPDGKPAEGVAIRVRPEDYLRDTSLWNQEPPAPDARTDAQGYFRMDSLPVGAYAMDAVGGRDLGVFRPLALRKGAMAPDTLRTRGVLEGRVELPEAAQGLTFIQIQGLERLIQAAPGGNFTVPDLAPGAYRLRAVHPFAGSAYEVPDPVRIESGDTTRMEVIRLIDFKQEDYSTWSHSLPITVETGAAGIAGTVRDFPLLVRLEDPRFDFTRSDGRDIRFSGPGGRRLPYQVDHWDAANRKAAVWVGLDTLPAGAGSYALTLHWGKHGAPDFSQGPAVFSTFAGAWHLADHLDTKGEGWVRDASPSQAHGEAHLAAGAQPGVIGRAAGFQGTHFIRALRTAALKPRDGLTLSLWANLPMQPNPDMELISMGNNYALRSSSKESLVFFAAPDIPDWTATQKGDDRWMRCRTENVGLQLSGWRHVTAVYDGDSLKTFLDGKPVGATFFNHGLGYNHGDAFVIGQHANLSPGFQLKGWIDEAQVSARARSHAWIRLAYENQRPGSTLVRFR